MTKRKITDLYNVKFVPFDNYGSEVPGMSWYKISYDKKNGGYGSYLLKMEPGAKSLSHAHTGYEESKHFSHTKNGCLVLVFMRGINEPI